MAPLIQKIRATFSTSVERSLLEPWFYAAFWWVTLCKLNNKLMGKSPSFIGKITVSTAMFNSYVINYQRVYTLLGLYDGLMIAWLASVPSKFHLFRLVAFGTHGHAISAPFFWHQHQRSMWALWNLCPPLWEFAEQFAESLASSMSMFFQSSCWIYVQIWFSPLMSSTCWLILSIVAPDRLLVTLPRASRTLGFSQLSGQVGQHPISLDTWLLRRRYTGLFVFFPDHHDQMNCINVP